MGDLAAGSLLGMLVLLFSSEGQKMLEYPLTVALIAVPVLLHFVVMVAGTHLAAWLLRYRYKAAAMAALIGLSTQFEVAIGTAMVVFGLVSGAALATVVGPLIEVPVMVTATEIAQTNSTLLPTKMREAEVLGSIA